MKSETTWMYYFFKFFVLDESKFLCKQMQGLLSYHKLTILQTYVRGRVNEPKKIWNCDHDFIKSTSMLGAYDPSMLKKIYLVLVTNNISVESFVQIIEDANSVL